MPVPHSGREPPCVSYRMATHVSMKLVMNDDSRHRIGHDLDDL